MCVPLTLGRLPIASKLCSERTTKPGIKESRVLTMLQDVGKCQILPRQWRIELLASIYLGNELIHIDTREYLFREVQLVLPS